MSILVSISFDDGNENHFTEFYPILEDYGLKATFYVITSLLGKKGMLNKYHLKELYNHGNEIGSHTHTHPNLTRLSTDSLVLELSKSKEILKEFGCTTMAYPYGYYDERCIYYTKRFYSAARGYGKKDYGINRPEALNLYSLKMLPTQQFISNHSFPEGLAIFVFHGKFSISSDLILWFLRNKRVEFLRRKALRNSLVRIKDSVFKSSRSVNKSDSLTQFRNLCDFLSANDSVKVRTISDALKDLGLIDNQEA
ncbi:MAG: polysaccharide deacetylase family protein [Candidatus Bathyarchaeales archaeon]